MNDKSFFDDILCLKALNCTL